MASEIASDPPNPKFVCLGGDETGLEEGVLTNPNEYDARWRKKDG